MTASVVVFDLHGNESAARDAVVFLSNQPVSCCHAALFVSQMCVK